MPQRFDLVTALREADRLLRVLVNSLELPVQIVDSENHVVHENPFKCGKGLSRHQFAESCKHPPTPGRICPYCQLEMELRQGRVQEMNTRIAGFQCQFRLEPVEWDEGRLTRVDAFLVPSA